MPRCRARINLRVRVSAKVRVRVRYVLFFENGGLWESNLGVRVKVKG